MKSAAWRSTTLVIVAGLFIGSVNATPSAIGEPAASCLDIRQDPQLSLGRYIERSLCANLDTRAAWQRVQTQREQVGVAKAGYYPSLSASASSSRDFGDRLAGSDPDQRTLSANASWLLYDFGGREAGVAQAKNTLRSLQASSEASVHSLAAQAVSTWFNRLASDASVASAKASLAAAKETAEAAEKRITVGVGTREDTLQAQTALAQAQLVLIQREGELAASNGQLAVLANYSANTVLMPETTLPDPMQLGTPPALATLMQLADERRPERIAQQQQVAAAESTLDQLAAQRLPRISLNASAGDSRNSLGQREAGQVALTATLPLFTGFQQRYQERTAQGQISQQSLELDRIRQQVGLEVWLAWQQLTTARSRIDASDSLLTSASESSRAALARYRAGLGNVLNVLSAQSTLADARQQQARSRFDWASARVQLARAAGLLAASPDAAFQDIQP
ncbi:MAG: TolC family protein [Paraperlucidibaca sp.]